MKKIYGILSIVAVYMVFALVSCQQAAQSSNDPLNAVIHTMDNGMKLYLSVNKDVPRVQTMIATRAGSKYDPANATGLAHYLEHMLFKGTSKIASLDWEKEEPLLQKISDLYEKHRNTKDDAERKKIYQEIDKISQEAAQYVSFNEYDDMMTSMGAKGTNAFTSQERTVYINDIPTNEIEKWMKLESERFRMCVLRLFHTELEAVYEEFNISQDRDLQKGNRALSAGLFPTHPYGTQTTIGTGEHLKNPSHVEILDYFNKYYVPNNMAIIIAGDFDPEQVIKWAEENFGDYERKDVPEFTYTEQAELTEPVVKEVIGKEQAYVDMAWKVGGVKTDDPLLLELVKGVLYNGQAGLIDLNINQAQAAKNADAWSWDYIDYSTFGLYAVPTQGQTLEELKDLLLAELDKVKKGEFEEWLIPAVIKNKKLQALRGIESNQGRAFVMLDAFIKEVAWEDIVNRYDKLSKYTKEDIVKFANENFNDNNYVIVYKRKGEDKDVFKVEKPTITPLTVNRENKSGFFGEFSKLESQSIEPTFADYDKEINTQKLSSGVELDYVKNKVNPTFSMNYILDIGKSHDKILPLAVQYLEFLGTDKYTAEELKEEFFKLGLSFSVFTGDKESYVTLSGLDESFEEGVKLFEHILANAKPDEEALKKMVEKTIKSREDNKSDKFTILRRGMFNYAKHGQLSPFTDILTATELRRLKGQELVDLIKNMCSYEHRIFYYGQKSPSDVASILNEYHTVPAELKPTPEEKIYEELAQENNRVYFLDFPIVQAEVLMMSKGTENYNKEEQIMAELYNNYFGFGLSSIVFQEIREAKALAYSTYAYYGTPARKDQAHYLQAYVGTQADKLKDAVTALEEIVRDMPISDDKINNARNSLLKKIESEPITKSRVYWSSRTANRRGLDYDVRKDIYAKMKTVTPEELAAFQQKNVKDRKFDYLVLGDKKRLDMKYLKTIGEVKELKIEDVFGDNINVEDVAN